MKALLIDVGNTRVKWAQLVNGKLGRQHAVPHEEWNARLLARAGRSCGKILVVSVAGAKIENQLTRAARVMLGKKAVFVRTKRRLAGVTTRYREPWRLGTDRLVAAIGAHRLAAGRAACVVGIGTAMTIDLVDADGIHRGGSIIPGPQLMIESLLNGTSGIQRRAGGRNGARSLFARDTRGALEQGARYAIAGAIDRAVLEAKAILGSAPLLLLTGGAAPQVRRLLRTRHRLVPDLVLRGLAALV
jgi:type III pantothenate kinase